MQWAFDFHGRRSLSIKQFNKSIIDKSVVYSCLTDAPLSAEAKSVAAQAHYSGVASVVSIVVNLNEGVPFNFDILCELLVAGWGEKLAQHIECVSVCGKTDFETLQSVQLPVSTGYALFSVGSVICGNYQRCYLSIHHALADEHTLKLFSSLIQLSHAGNRKLAVQLMNRGKDLYEAYVKHQCKAEEASTSFDVLSQSSMTPVKLSKTNKLAWSSQEERIRLHRTVQANGAGNLMELLIEPIANYLANSNIIAEGNIVCSSRSWRLPGESGAIGMMTGLVAISLENAIKVPTQAEFSLEACARYSLTARRILASCRSSELFINGAVSRSILGSQVVSAAFPVGIDIKLINTSEFQFELEGAFCSKWAAKKFLDNLSGIVSERREFSRCVA